MYLIDQYLKVQHSSGVKTKETEPKELTGSNTVASQIENELFSVRGNVPRRFYWHNCATAARQYPANVGAEGETVIYEDFRQKPVEHLKYQVWSPQHANYESFAPKTQPINVSILDPPAGPPKPVPNPQEELNSLKTAFIKRELATQDVSLRRNLINYH